MNSIGSSSSFGMGGDDKGDFGKWFEGIKVSGASTSEVDYKGSTASMSNNSDEESATLLFKSSFSKVGNGLQDAIGTAWNNNSNPLKQYVNLPFGNDAGSGNKDIEAAASAAMQKGNEPSVGESIEDTTNALSRTDRFKGFVFLLSLSGFFFIMALIFLPAVVLLPSKFAFSFTMCNLCFMGGFALVQGPTYWLKSVCSWDRLPFTLSYFGSMLATLISCLVIRSYILIIFFSAVQCVALAHYGFSYLPGGQYGLKLISKVCSTFASGCAKSCSLIFSAISR